MLRLIAVVVLVFLLLYLTKLGLNIKFPQPRGETIAIQEAMAKSKLRAISVELEKFAAANNGQYPENANQLFERGAYQAADCGKTVEGYNYTCSFGKATYFLQMTPVKEGRAYTVTTGGLMAP